MNNLFNVLRVKKDFFFYNKSNRKNIKNFTFVTLFIIIAFFISMIVLVSLGYDFNKSIEHIFTATFNKYLYKDMLTQVATFGVAGLAFLFAYKCGLFNIGVTGQMMGAGLAFIGVSKTIDSTLASSDGAFMITIVVAILAGAFVALISGVLKTLLNIHEVVSGIMINWIIFFMTKFFIGTGGDLNLDGLISLQLTPQMSIYSQAHSSGFIGAIVIFLVCTIAVWFLLKFTVFGKKIKSVGLSKDASIYSGYSTKVLQLSSFAISGSIAGLLAVIVYAGNADRAMPFPFIETLPQYGFDGIALTLIAFANPIALVPVSFLLGFIKTASVVAAPFPSTFGDLLLGIIMYGVAIFVLVYRYKPIDFIKKKLAQKEKYKNNYYINKYSEEKQEYTNNIEKLVADRKIQLFLENQKIKRNIKWIEKQKIKYSNLCDLNKKYIDEKQRLSIHKTSFLAAITRKTFYSEITEITEGEI